MISYPDRAARQENGIYRWRCEVEAEYEKRAGVYAMTACLIIAVFIGYDLNDVFTCHVLSFTPLRPV